MEGGNVLHHVKRGGIIRMGNVREIYPGEMSACARRRVRMTDARLRRTPAVDDRPRTTRHSTHLSPRSTLPSSPRHAALCRLLSRLICSANNLLAGVLIIQRGDAAGVASDCGQTVRVTTKQSGTVTIRDVHT